jgi:hypothetical protein
MSEILLASQTAWYSNKCTLTWKAKVTKSNRLLYQLQQSTHRTNDTEHGLWLTPSATNIDKRSDAALKKRQKYRESIGRTTINPGNLAEQVQYGFPIKDMRMWPTPTVGYVEGGEQSDRVERTDKGGYILRKKNKPHMTCGAKLSDAILFEEKQKMWPTPTTQDSKNNGGKAQHNRHIKPLNAVVNGSLNPMWVEWLMGYPVGWTDLKD